jgi:hypothetical protein
MPDLHHQPTLITTFPKYRAEATNVAIVIQDRSLGREIDDLLGHVLSDSLRLVDWKVEALSTARAE